VDGTVNPPAAVFASAHSSLRAMSVFRGSTNLAYWRLPLVYLARANCGYCGYCGVLQVWGTVGYVQGAVPWVLLGTAVASVGRRLALVYWPALAT
jgi:hypothetical protein